MLYPARLSFNSANLTMIFAKSWTRRPFPCSIPSAILAFALAIISSTAALTFSRAARTIGLATAILASTTAFSFSRKSTTLAFTSPEAIFSLSWLKMSLMCWATSIISEIAMYSTYVFGTSLPIRSPRCFWMVGIRFSIALPRAGFKTSLRRSSKMLYPARLSFNSANLAMILAKSWTRRPFPCSMPASALALALAIISSIAALIFSRAAWTIGVAAAILASTTAFSFSKKSWALAATSPEMIFSFSWSKISLMCWAISMISVRAIYSAGFNLSTRSPRCLEMVGIRFSIACFNAGLRTSWRRSSKMLYPANSCSNLAKIFSKSWFRRPFPCSMPASALALALAMISSTAALTFSSASCTIGLASAILASMTAFSFSRKSTTLALTSPEAIFSLSWLKMSLMCWAISMMSAKARYSTYSLGTNLLIRSPKCFEMVGMRFSMAFPRAGFKTSFSKSSKMLYPPINLSLSSAILAMIFSRSCWRTGLTCSIPAWTWSIMSWIAAFIWAKISATTGLVSAILASTTSLICFKKSSISPLTAPDSILALTWSKISLMWFAASTTSVMLIYSAGWALGAGAAVANAAKATRPRKQRTLMVVCFFVRTA